MNLAARGMAIALIVGIAVVATAKLIAWAVEVYRSRRQLAEIEELEHLVEGRRLSIGFFIETIGAARGHTQAASAIEIICLRLQKLGIRLGRIDEPRAQAIKTQGWSRELALDRSVDPPRPFDAIFVGDWTQSFDEEDELGHFLRLAAYDNAGHVLSSERERHVFVPCRPDKEMDREIEELDLAGYRSFLLPLSCLTDRGRRNAGTASEVTATV